MNMTWQDTQNMLPFEREIVFNRLYKQLEYEKKLINDAEGK